MTTFSFEGYRYNPTEREATFTYRFSNGHSFIERLFFEEVDEHYDSAVLDRALRLAFLCIGTSYAKAFLASEATLPFTLDAPTASFLNAVYQEGMSQYAYENGLTRQDLLHFSADTDQNSQADTSLMTAGAGDYEGEGLLVLQSGGKDSLLLARLLQENEVPFTPWYCASSQTHPAVLDTFAEPVAVTRRYVDIEHLRAAQEDGGRNGHVPVTYIVQSIALIQAVLLNKNTVLLAIGHEGEEPHAYAGDLAVRHQWSKTAGAEELMAAYVSSHVSASLVIGSPLRRFSELRIAELFSRYAWPTYGHSFSSCNVANYTLGAHNSQLSWCGDCPKCANSFLLFAPFIAQDELLQLFNGAHLFTKPSLTEVFRGLLGIDGVMKPLECVGEVDELRYAYHKALSLGYASLPFDVPPSATFSLSDEYPHQETLARYATVGNGEGRI